MAKARKQIKERVYFSDSEEYNIPSNPKEFIKYWTDKIDQIPDKYKDDARIDIETQTYYGDCKLVIDIYYYRPETLAEKRERLALHKKYQDAITARELAQLEKLQQKYKKAII